MAPTPEQRSLVDRFATALETGEAALFAGAGLSASAGCVDWRGFSRQFAADLSLDVDRERDLVALVQYHINERDSRAQVVAALERAFSACDPTDNHHLLARLPLHTVWTTNYDRLLETAFERAGKVVDVRVTQEDFARSRRADVTLYKMHGCVTRADEAIVAKDDYETYEHTRSLFVDGLKGDLISRTFLFLGFSFTDPNIDYILSRVRVLLGRNQREHLCLMRRPPPTSDDADTAAEARRVELRVGDLRRFGIETAFVAEYEEIDDLLRMLATRLRRRNVFISAASTQEREGGAAAVAVCRALGARLVDAGMNLVTALDRGPAEQAVLGAMDAWSRSPHGLASDRLVTRGPRDDDPPSSSGLAFARRDLLQRSGTLIVVGGGAPGAGEPDVRADVAAARVAGCRVVPLPGTGGVARELWTEMAPRDRALRAVGGDGRDADAVAAAVVALLEPPAT
jgi:hypothetical protein